MQAIVACLVASFALTKLVKAIGVSKVSSKAK